MDQRTTIFLVIVSDGNVAVLQRELRYWISKFYFERTKRFKKQFFLQVISLIIIVFLKERICIQVLLWIEFSKRDVNVDILIFQGCLLLCFGIASVIIFMMTYAFRNNQSNKIYFVHTDMDDKFAFKNLLYLHSR